MAAVTTLARGQAETTLPALRARIGMIIPSVNSMTEPQFNHFAPPGLGVHVARARVAGPWKRPLAAMADEIATSAKLLADVAPDLIVFHCTDTSMTQGPQGEGRILDIIQDATGIAALATSRLVLEALQALGLRSLILLSPYEGPAGRRRRSSPALTGTSDALASPWDGQGSFGEAAGAVVAGSPGLRTGSHLSGPRKFLVAKVQLQIRTY
jgi:hypothetical protein